MQVQNCQIHYIEQQYFCINQYCNQTKRLCCQQCLEKPKLPAKSKSKKHEIIYQESPQLPHLYHPVETLENLEQKIQKLTVTNSSENQENLNKNNNNLIENQQQQEIIYDQQKQQYKKSFFDNNFAKLTRVEFLQNKQKIITEQYENLKETITQNHILILNSLETAYQHVDYQIQTLISDLEKFQQLKVDLHFSKLDNQFQQQQNSQQNTTRVQNSTQGLSNYTNNTNQTINIEQFQDLLADICRNYDHYFSKDQNQENSKTMTDTNNKNDKNEQSNDTNQYKKDQFQGQKTVKIEDEIHQMFNKLKSRQYEYVKEMKQDLQEFDIYCAPFQSKVLQNQLQQPNNSQNPTFQQTQLIQKNKNWVFGVEYVNKDLFVSCSTESYFKLWDQKKLELVKEMHGHDGKTMVLCLLALNSETIISGGSDKNIIVWDTTGKIKHVLLGHDEWIIDLQKVCNYQFLSLGKDRAIYLWDMNLKQNIRSYIGGHTANITGLTHLLYTDYFLTASEDNTIQGWSLLQSNTRLFVLTVPQQVSSHPGSILQIKEDYFITGHYQYILVWRVSQAKVVKQFKAHQDYINKLKLINSDMFISSSLDKSFSIYNIEGLKHILTLNGHENQVTGISTLDTETIISCSSDQSIKIWK